MRRHQIELALIALAFSVVARAADDATKPAGDATTMGQLVPPPKGRILNGHAFLPAADVPGALPTTSFVADMVLGIGTASAPNPITIGNRTVSGDFQYTRGWGTSSDTSTRS